MFHIHAVYAPSMLGLGQQWTRDVTNDLKWPKNPAYLNLKYLFNIMQQSQDSEWVWQDFPLVDVCGNTFVSLPGLHTMIKITIKHLVMIRHLNLTKT